MRLNFKNFIWVLVVGFLSLLPRTSLAAANVTLTGDNTCSGPAAFNPTEVAAYPGDNVTLVFTNTEAEEWSVYTSQYRPWGSIFVPPGQSRSISFTAPDKSFSYSGAWKSNGCFRASGVVRVLPRPVDGAPPLLVTPTDPPAAADKPLTFGATAAPAPIVPKPVQADIDTTTAIGPEYNPATSAPVSDQATTDAADKVSAVGFKDILILVGALMFVILAVAGLMFLSRPKAAKHE